ncbi:MAG TPA: antitoxin Xre/MbcA/ParS toxin-binding domain-containing protein [Opitutales bacterium]|nr:antitoxin Xre/MbcA/ParS toxin-binding domain-containing protein [Opitutales bacterium]
MNKKRKKPLRHVEEPTAVYQEADTRSLPETAEKTVARIRSGLPFAEFEALRDLLELSSEELADRLGISRSTLARRKTAGQLDRDQSDKVLRFARIFGLAKSVFEGDEAVALRWMKAPQRALAYTSPLDFTDTEAGAREVEHLLGRIEHGVYS